MYIALNENDERVDIKHVITGEIYYCPVCHESLLIRRGQVKQHHFAHKKDTQCKDSWKHDMTEWHYSWQECFPIENREIVMRSGDVIHRTDVFTNGTVIEFQHSPMSPEEFKERNEFYNSLGYKVVWVFDLIDEYNKGRIRCSECNGYIYFEWNTLLVPNPHKGKEKVFNKYDIINGQIEVFLQIDDKENEKAMVCVSKKTKLNWKPYSVWSFTRFPSRRWYSKNDFISYIEDTLDGLEDTNEHQDGYTSTEENISTASEIILKHWLNDNLQLANIETKVPITAFSDTTKKYEFSFISRRYRIAVNYCHEGENLTEENIQILEENANGIKIIFINNSLNFGSDGKGAEERIKIQNRQGYCLLLTVDASSSDKADLRAVYYEKDFDGIWRELIFADGDLKNFRIKHDGKIMFKDKYLTDLLASSKEQFDVNLDNERRKAEKQQAESLKQQKLEEERWREEQKKRLEEAEKQRVEKIKRQKLEEEQKREEQKKRLEETEKQRAERFNKQRLE